MKVHREERILPYQPDQVFNLVADIERYPEFLPWCTGVRIKSRTANEAVAEMLIGFKMIRERFTSRVVLDRIHHRIDVTYINGPFRHLKNYWRFLPAGPDHCRVEFYLEFAFSSPILQKLIGTLFHEAVRRMVVAFEIRAGQLYGPKV
ncbi:MAG TPA: type II toxin-antitoxin system RatA family toxin [Dongiaceae bacterium]|jgi:coenzyme Q-binding protein COQ10|nr:type II toxin-antitoxin system RatA family toxin [Dongiaceae bacterium]